MKDFIKLLIALWIVKKLIVDNDLADKLTDKIKSIIKKILE